jgi:hypothetical protein
VSAAKARRKVVVDGSNLATEGRSVPSLSQLTDAVAAWKADHPGHEVIVVVDASFEHKVAEAERAKVTEAEHRGELIITPAGAIGRGDAFLLQIAERADATVLSNDSFQEFHKAHPWLFEDGRLIGGKAVPGVGWVFTPRVPVRGQKTARVSTKKATATKVPAKKVAVAK